MGSVIIRGPTQTLRPGTGPDSAQNANGDDQASPVSRTRWVWGHVVEPAWAAEASERLSRAKIAIQRRPPGLRTANGQMISESSTEGPRPPDHRRTQDLLCRSREATQGSSPCETNAGVEDSMSDFIISYVIWACRISLLSPSALRSLSATRSAEKLSAFGMDSEPHGSMSSYLPAAGMTQRRLLEWPTGTQLVECSGPVSSAAG